MKADELDVRARLAAHRRKLIDTAVKVFGHDRRHVERLPLLDLDALVANEWRAQQSAAPSGR